MVVVHGDLNWKNTDYNSKEWFGHCLPSDTGIGNRSLPLRDHAQLTLHMQGFFCGEGTAGSVSNKTGSSRY